MKTAKSKKPDAQIDVSPITPEKKNENGRKTITCRYCKTDTLIKAKPRNFIDTYIFPIIRISPYRCSNCKRRDYYFERA